MNVKVGVVSLVRPLGPPVMLVSSITIVNEREAVGGSANTPSNARTENV